MFAPIFLYITALGWLLYGLYCFLQPQALGALAGIGPLTATGATELRAMYGGLQAGIGLMALIGARENRWQRSVLLSLFCIYGGLVSARAIAAVSGGDYSAYTLGALAFEGLSCLISLSLFRRSAR